MLFGLIDRATTASPLKSALDQSVERSRGIADRVSKATLNNGDGFALKSNEAGANGAAGSNANPVNIEEEMTALADEQLRFLATSRLLEKTYASLRTAIKGER
jgi:flagellar basal body rod protein FlgB